MQRASADINHLLQALGARPPPPLQPTTKLSSCDGRIDRDESLDHAERERAALAGTTLLGMEQLAVVHRPYLEQRTRDERLLPDTVRRLELLLRSGRVGPLRWARLPPARL